MSFLASHATGATYAPERLKTPFALLRSLANSIRRRTHSLASLDMSLIRQFNCGFPKGEVKASDLSGLFEQAFKDGASMRQVYIAATKNPALAEGKNELLTALLQALREAEPGKLHRAFTFATHKLDLFSEEPALLLCHIRSCDQTLYLILQSRLLSGSQYERALAQEAQTLFQNRA
ncbi:Uncharacterised protein [Candidatus Anstonella stagnisolia]|nr:Uncharacterised protein [Candidatus Anstonella stagnisolia]